MNHQDKLMNLVKSRGFLIIIFRPSHYDPLRIKNLSECKKLIEENRVDFRGWYYPHFPSRDDEDTGLIAGNNFYEGWINWGAHKELWRMYQSGQFFHCLALREDWMQEDGWYEENLRKIPPKMVLEIVWFTYQVTEIFEFLSRLAQRKIFEEGVDVKISLNNTKDRKLILLDPTRGPLFEEYKSGLEKIEFSRLYTKEETITKSEEIALKVVLYFFERFNWDKPSIDIIKNDQKKLINRKN
ncbi:MAG: hypothetical protein HY787_15235 [Deltaproteobacteria bacterium]|nr:hypothetical protein [Deltaproteobacteria bacterium]